MPSVELIATALTLRGATTIGAIIGLGLLLTAPLMDRLLRPKPWWTPLVGLATAGGLVGMSLVGGHEARPTPTTLLYLTP